MHQLVAKADVWDGQTVVVVGPRPTKKEHAAEVNKNLVIFVTPTIINPDGTRYHADEEMPFAQGGSLTPRTVTQ